MPRCAEYYEVKQDDCTCDAIACVYLPYCMELVRKSLIPKYGIMSVGDVLTEVIPNFIVDGRPQCCHERTHIFLYPVCLRNVIFSSLTFRSENI